MKKIIKFIIAIEILLIIICCHFLFVTQKVVDKKNFLIKERHELVNAYMKQNNLPIDEDIIVYSFLDYKEQEEQKKLRRQYDAIDMQIYSRERKIINELKDQIKTIDIILNYLVYTFFILLSIITFCFLITKTPIKQIDFKNNLNQTIPITASIIFLLLAIFEIDIIEEDAFYSLLKIIVSATLFYISFIIKNSKSILFWLSLSLAILFNPIVQIHLNDSDLWQKIDIFTICYLIAYIILKLKRGKQ